MSRSSFEPWRSRAGALAPVGDPGLRGVADDVHPLRGDPETLAPDALEVGHEVRAPLLDAELRQPIRGTEGLVDVVHQVRGRREVAGVRLAMQDAQLGTHLLHHPVAHLGELRGELRVDRSVPEERVNLVDRPRAVDLDQRRARRVARRGRGGLARGVVGREGRAAGLHGGAHGGEFLLKRPEGREQREEEQGQRIPAHGGRRARGPGKVGAPSLRRDDDPANRVRRPPRRSRQERAAWTSRSVTSCRYANMRSRRGRTRSGSTSRPSQPKGGA